MTSAFGAGNVRAPPTSRVSGFIPISGEVDSSLWPAILVVNGASRGPRLWVISGLHGDEYDSCIAAEKLAKMVDPNKLRGTLVVLPIANVQAWRARSYESPDDKEDMSFVFPGDLLGSRTRQIAHAIFAELIPRCDVLVDLHNGNTVNMVMKHSYCSSGDGADGSKDLALAFGFPMIVEVEEPFEGLLMCEAEKRGIRSIIAECGGEGRIHAGLVSDMVEGLSNVMSCLGMIEGTVRASGRPTFSRWSPGPGMEGHLRATRSGYLGLKVEPGDFVSKGEVIAEVTDISGELAETLRAPYDTIVTELRTWATVNVGDIVAFTPVLR